MEEVGQDTKACMLAAKQVLTYYYTSVMYVIVGASIRSLALAIWSVQVHAQW